MGMVRKVYSNRGDRIKISSDAPNVKAKVTIPRRRPIMFSISKDKDYTVET